MTLEQLGYYKYEDNLYFIRYTKGDVHVMFYKATKEYDVSRGYHYHEISTDLHNAITNKMIELGWI